MRERSVERRTAGTAPWNLPVAALGAALLLTGCEGGKGNDTAESVAEMSLVLDNRLGVADMELARVDARPFEDNPVISTVPPGEMDAQPMYQETWTRVALQCQAGGDWETAAFIAGPFVNCNCTAHSDATVDFQCY